MLVPFEALVSPTLLLLLLPALWFLVHPHPWPVRGFIVFFGRATPLEFGCLFIAMKAQAIVLGCLDSYHLASCFDLVLWGLD
jgi:hypothetical protein